MTLGERSARIITAVSAEKSAASSQDLIERGQLISAQLRSTRELALEAGELRRTFEYGRPEVDPKPLAKKLKALERRLAEKSVHAVDRQDASNAEEEARLFSKRLASWAGGEWQRHHAPAITAVNAVDELDPQGRPETLRQIRVAKQRLVGILKHNPLSQRVDLFASLDVENVVDASAAILKRAQLLNDLVSELRSQAEELSPTVKAALKKAATDEGLPLSGVSPELLAELTAAGLADTLSVHS
jgi:hypothetical protein